MKNINLALGIVLVGVLTTSCKNEKEEQAQKKVDHYVQYVDSVKGVTTAELKANWKAVEDGYAIRVNEAENALVDVKDKSVAEAKVNGAKEQYDAFKADFEAATATSNKQQLRDALFGAGNVGEDMSFTWVNAKNIHEVYQNFVHTVENNKDSYSREDWDEIKLMYEALDNRKNTVEKEGLSSKDNMKISGLKIKFSSMYTTNRVGAKSEENAEAKE